MRQIVPRKRRRDRRTPGRVALEYAARGWPVLPAVAAASDGSCHCRRPTCPAPGAHPGGPDLPDLPELLAATTEPRMVRRWWTVRPHAPVLLATGGAAPCAVSLPAPTGRRALAALDVLDVRTGPVLATPERLALLVAPYEVARLGEVLCGLLDGPRLGWAWDGTPTGRLPDGLRFHGSGGYLPLPPFGAGRGGAEWLRAPEPVRWATPGPPGADPSGTRPPGPVPNVAPSGDRARCGGTVPPARSAAVPDTALPEAAALLRALLDAERLGLLAAPTTVRRRAGTPPADPGGDFRH